MKTPLVLITVFLFGSGCNYSNKKTAAPASNQKSYHAEEEIADKAYLNFKGVLGNLYAFADTNPKQAIPLANRLILLYQDSIKLRGFSVSEIDDLHYFKGEVFYQLGKYRNSVIEFTEYDVGAEEALASSYIKLKEFGSAYTVLTKIDSNTCLFDYQWGNYYEIIRDKAKAIFHYKKVVESNWINSGAYEILKGKITVRLKSLSDKNYKFLTDLDFPSHNPKNTSPCY
jgi:hypothetical protein